MSVDTVILHACGTTVHSGSTDIYIHACTDWYHSIKCSHLHVHGTSGDSDTAACTLDPLIPSHDSFKCSMIYPLHVGTSGYYHIAHGRLS